MNSETTKKSGFLQILKGAIFAVSISLVGILLFALLIKFTNLNEKWILPINQVIKIVSIFFGIMLAFNRGTNKGFLKGMLIGFIYTVLAYVVFSILARQFSFTLNSITDMIFGAIIGGISGIIVINIKK